MNLISRFIVPLAWGAMTACSGPVQIQTAPMSQKDVGFLIQGTQSETQKVIDQSTSFRVINPNHHIYEIKGLSLEEIQRISPQILANKNHYYEGMIQGSSPDSSNYFEAYKTLTQQNNSSSTLSNIPSIPPALVGCDLQNNKRPTPQVNVLSEVLLKSPTMNLGETLELGGEKSFTNKSDPQLEFRWDVITPVHSQQTPGVTQGSRLSFTPDSVGYYQVALVVQDFEKACAALLVKFLVTHNPEIEEVNWMAIKPSLDLTPFSHLNKVDAHSAWKQTTGEKIIIAVLDTGLNYNHKAIQYNLALNQKEQEGNEQFDNDKNGFDNDDLGWDFVNGDNRPFDDEGHGSHVGGLTSSHIFGVAKSSKILPIKVLNAAGGGDVGSVIAGIYYATDNGARVINASLQRLNNEENALARAVEYAHSKGVVFVSSSGNDALDLSLPGNDIYPGELDVANVINVGATGSDNQITSYSNFGSEQVHVAAPGGDQTEPIYSLATLNAHNQNFVGSGGTSMAAPIVSGIVALVLSINPNLSPEEVKEILLRSGTEDEGLRSFVSSSRVINAQQATEEAQASILFVN